MQNLLVVFSHGKESGPWGSKIRTLANIAQRLGAQVLSVDYREHPVGTNHDQNAPGEADRRVGQLLSITPPEHRQLVLVGSSMGGYVSTVASIDLPVDGLFLLAPAFYLPGYGHQDLVPRAKRTLIVHGWSDGVVPAQNSIRFARQHHCDLHLLDGDHRLNAALPKIEPLFELFLRQVVYGLSTPESTSPLPDTLLPEARKLRLTQLNPSAAFLQLQLGIDFDRAVRLIRQLDDDVVTAPDQNSLQPMLQSGSRLPSDPVSRITLTKSPEKFDCMETSMGMHSLTPKERKQHLRRLQLLEKQDDPDDIKVKLSARTSP